MTRNTLVFTILALALHSACVSSALAHHGPRHDEIDEFDSPTARLMVPAPATGVSWPAVVLSIAGVAIVSAFSRRHGINAPVPAACGAGR
jgi:hypothetical protein